ncbi:MAG: alpha/beta hydrolase [Anaerolineales bacterium]|nr:alpha/beta hydrolase [Anaerolineales bacterium]
MNQTITLSDRRKLGFAEFGDVKGRPVFLFHGQPGNRLFRHPDNSILLSLGVRLITVDRPGYGLSDYQPHRKLLDWAQDIVELAEALGIEYFAVVGFSGGGPYAAACAYKIPHRVIKIGLVDSAPPMTVPEISKKMPTPLRINYLLAHYAPALLVLLFKAYWRSSRRRPEAFINLAMKQSSPVDREILSNPDMYNMMIDVWKENIRVNSQGYTQDTEILMKDWGFCLRDIKTDVYLWQGEADVNIPSAWARYMTQEIPHCKSTIFADEGHFVLLTHWQEIIQILTKD